MNHDTPSASKDVHAPRKPLRFEDIPMGRKQTISRTITGADVDTFGHLCGDLNPLHMDEAFAAKTAERGRIAHGLLSASFGSAVVGTIMPGAGAIYLGQTMAFHKPVRIGDEVLSRVTIAAIDEETARVILRCEALVGETLVMDGEATVRVPRRRRPLKS